MEVFILNVSVHIYIPNEAVTGQQSVYRPAVCNMKQITKSTHLYFQFTMIQVHITGRNVLCSLLLRMQFRVIRKAN